MREMKNSGVEWIGEIPIEWQSRKLFGLLSSVGSGTTPKGDEYYSANGFPWLNTGDLNDGYISETSKFVTEDALRDCSALQIHKAGAVVIAMYGATIGKLGITELDVTTNQACCVMNPSKDLEKKYLFYLLSAAKDYFIYSSYGAGQPNISQNTIKQLKIPYTCIQEQKRIADYLDSKCAKIDSIIEKQQAIIEKLKEYKLSVITEAVTKGLNPDVEMKDSGIEWIGKIPINYEINTFKRYCNVNQGLQIAQSERKLEDGDGRYKYITVKFLNSDDQDYMIEYIENPPESTICCEDDILMARTGATGLVVTGVRGCFHNNFFRINYNKKHLEHDYLVYYLMQDCIKSYLLLMAGTTTIPDLNHGDFYSTPLVIPPIEEQIIISKYLLEKCSSINKLIQQKIEVVTKIIDYKKSLIYEVVTGKKEV